MLTMKGKYGIKALIHLARLEPGQVQQSTAIAAANGIPKKFLDTILADLRQAGLIDTRKGRSGGYQLARPADTISVAQILRVIDGPIAPISCVSKTAYRKCHDCPTQDACKIRLLMLDVRDAMLAILEHRTLRDLCASVVLTRQVTGEDQAAKA
ncbi:RrF2 family transcriptional regulator [Paracoccus laeviglucosivorans]|uniref:Transcriptional regulator, BadM/Rrf2 family n=1 Tax=Paracoccus laeviglucosivorans TaxID=1197861 RepID=A0A521ETV0_9RHOB|nr:Rrf2 family transcriptional regulator [Paracoccus laeviglucosivorans]SMO86841.1 transcriptional regulator, BadM/Rrf2 family [Paracoccus laeviglucosivorans]